MCVGQNTPVTAQRFFYDHAPAVTGQVKTKWKGVNEWWEREREKERKGGMKTREENGDVFKRWF